MQNYQSIGLAAIRCVIRSDGRHLHSSGALGFTRGSGRTITAFLGKATESVSKGSRILIQCRKGKSYGTLTKSRKALNVNINLSRYVITVARVCPARFTRCCRDSRCAREAPARSKRRNEGRSSHNQGDLLNILCCESLGKGKWE